MDELDRILASEEPLVPSSRFAERVMEAVREAPVAPPLPFPWRRFALGLAASVVCIASGAMLVVGSGLPPEAVAGLGATARDLDAVAQELGYAAMVTVGTLAALRLQRAIGELELNAEG